MKLVGIGVLENCIYKGLSMNILKKHTGLMILMLTVSVVSHAGKMHKAAKRGDVEFVKTLIVAGADVNKVARFGSQSPLYIAAKNGHADVVGVLMEKGAKVNISTKQNLTPLHIAVTNGFYDVVNKLVAIKVYAIRKQVVNPQALKGLTALHLATKRGWLAIAESLIHHGTDVNKLSNDDAIRSYGWCMDFKSAGCLGAIAIGFKYGKVGLVRLLIDRNASLKPTKLNYSLYHAIAEGCTKDPAEKMDIKPNSEDTSIEMVRLLHDRGVSKLCNFKYKGWDDVAFDAEVYAYDLAATKSEKLIACNRILIGLLKPEFKEAYQSFGLPAGPYTKYWKTMQPLWKAVDTHSRSAIVIDNASGAMHTTIKRINKHGMVRSHLGLAAEFNRLNITKQLIAKGAAVNIDEYSGLRPVHWASVMNNMDLLELLFKHQARIDLTDKKGKVPMHYAAALGYYQIVSWLVSKKSNCNFQDKHGKTPLTHATANCIPLLIKAGAKVNAQDKNGWTPLHWAVHWADVDRVRELLKAGADPKIKNKQGQMPIWFIARDYKTFEPGEFTKPIVDLLKNPALANQTVATTSAESAPPSYEATATTSAAERTEADEGPTALPSYEDLFDEGPTSTLSAIAPEVNE